MFFDFLPITTDNIIGAAVGAAAFGTLIYLIRGFGATRTSAEAAQRTAEIAIKESKVRNHPWLSVTDCEYRSGSKQLVIQYTNGGTFPAYNLAIALRTVESTVRYSEDQIGIIFPEEKALARLDIQDQEDIEFTGSLNYFLGDQEYQTKFRVKLTFVDGRITNIEWKNIAEKTFPN